MNVALSSARKQKIYYHYIDLKYLKGGPIILNSAPTAYSLCSFSLTVLLHDICFYNLSQMFDFVQS